MDYDNRWSRLKTLPDDIIEAIRVAKKPYESFVGTRRDSCRS